MSGPSSQAPNPSGSSPAGNFPGFADPSDRDRLLLAKTEEAIRDGSQLARWWREQERELPFFPLDLKKSYRLPNKAEGFFGALPINGVPRSVMGCRQTVELGSLPGANAPARLRDFVLGEFQKRAHWTYDDGAPGGFTFEKLFFKTMAGNYGQFPAVQQDAKRHIDGVSPSARSAEGPPQGPMDWRDLGRRYAWVLLLVHIHDFVVNMGPFQRRIPEAAYVVPHPDFVRIVENPSPEYALEVSIGYPFVDVAPHPNIFGFGPGKFGAAVKLFSFLLTPKQDVRVRMVFAAAPRAQKVLDFGKHVPDPVYGGAEALRYLTLGLVKPAAIHDRMDSQMLTLHCQVHQTLMDGLEKVWTAWVSAKP
jgi:hypothetical protein